MADSATRDDLFRDAVAAIDAGDVTALDGLIAAHPRLVSDRLDAPGAWLRDKVGNALDTFFQRPYLLWFVAEDPVRTGTLPANIADVALTIIRAAQRARVEHLQEQLDYALRLVSWSWISRQCGVQIALIDVLLDAGAALDGNPDNALVNSNFDAAEHLVARGAPLTLSAALCLERWDDVNRLAREATSRQKQFAFILAALKGKTEGLRRIIDIGVDVNAVSPDLYPHASALHHAVSAGSLDAVKVLVAAGAHLHTRDTAYQGTPLDWAEHSEGKAEFDAIATFLRAHMPFETRRAQVSDAEAMAVAHRDSIRSLGPRFYPPNVVDDWSDGLTGDVYVKAMEGGEVFFVAVAEIDGAEAVLGFASDYRREESEHGTSVYVRGVAARQGIGSALLRLAEAHAIARGARAIHIEASLAGVEFYKANGFVEVSRGETNLRSGRTIACVFMQKALA